MKRFLLLALFAIVPATALAQKPDPSAEPQVAPAMPSGPDSSTEAYQAGYALGQMAGYAMCCCCPLVVLAGGGGLAVYLIQKKKADQGPGIG